MSAKRAWLLAGFLGVSFSVIFALPKLRIVDSALSTGIPDRIGMWYTKPFEASKEEKATLAADTVFSKARCGLPRYEAASPILGDYGDGKQQPPMDIADLSIVLSGEDLTNSIHRPERCMEAQGHKIHESVTLDVKVDEGRTMNTRRLVSTQILKTDEKGGQSARHCLTYYFFVGHNRLTVDHMERNKIDILDRLRKGEAQHWAYVLITMPYAPDGEDNMNGQLLPMEAADKKATSLLRDFCASNLNWDMLAATPPAVP